MNNEEITMSPPEHMRHELLIRLDEQVKGIASTLGRIETGYGADIALLKRDKMDKLEFVRLTTEDNELREKMGSDIDSLKMWRWYTAGGLVVLGAVFFWLFPQFSSIEDTVERAVADGVSSSLQEYEKPQ